MQETRCDLHLHSNASIGSDEWYTRFFGCPESYATPAQQYDLCKSRGMSLVTLTDHDTLAGGLQLLDRPDFFLSEEITALFPENKCIMHVLAWHITQAQHEEIQERRRDIYRLVEYLNSKAIAHALAHPLLSPNYQLDPDILERMILLFPTFEGRNGLLDARIDPDLTMLLDRLTPELIERLSQKHGMKPNGATPHRKILTAGTDDHVNRHSGTVFTAVKGEGVQPIEFLRRCMAGDTRIAGPQADLKAMAIGILLTSYHHLNREKDARPDYRNPFVDIVDVIAGRASDSATAKGIVGSLLAGAHKTAIPVGNDLDILRVDVERPEIDDARIVEALARLSDKVIKTSIDDLLDAAQDFDIYGLFGGLRDLAGGLMSGASIFFAADHFAKQELQVRKLWERWTAFPPKVRQERLAVFSDSLEQVDGVSTWCRRFVDQAHAAGREVLIPHCGELPSHFNQRASFHRLPAATSFTVPLYNKIQFHVPSLVDAVDWVWRQQISHIELSTPGPTGLVGLLAAKLLRLPVTASYHTEVPALIQPLGGNAMMASAARKYLAWFYSHVDRVFAFSSGSRDALIEMGVDADKLSVMPVAINPEDFSPAHRSHAVFELLNLDVGDRPVILSVGRISEEKNIPMIVEAVARLQDRAPRPLLLIAGDGPERETLESRFRDQEFVRFVGLQKGDTLKRLYATARLFVFASRVDTLGLVNMEAMSSGVPVLVPSDACIAEFVTDGISAQCYEFGVTGLASAIGRILDDPHHARRLSTNGRRAMVERWNQVPFSRIWKSFTQSA